MSLSITPKEIINDAIGFAWAIGDQDECFVKHVGHTLSAIYVGNGYRNVVDYSTPGWEAEDDMTEMYQYWEEVENICEIIGKDAFKEIAQSNPSSVYFDQWYIEEAEELKEKLSNAS